MQIAKNLAKSEGKSQKVYEYQSKAIFTRTRDLHIKGVAGDDGKFYVQLLKKGLSAPKEADGTLVEGFG